MRKTNILVVEDENIVAMNIQDILRNRGYHVHAIVSSGKEAIRLIEQKQPDVVLMDIKLKGEMDGVDAAARIRENFDIPVVYLTAYADNDTLERAKITEPFGYLLKPFQEKELHTTIEMALYKHKMEKKLKEREQWLSTTLKSIGDAVISTDITGKVTFMNPIAEVITGRNHRSLTNEKLKDLVQIANGTTKNEIECPVEQVLRKGDLVNLSDHTLYAVKNGMKISIDCNATPIRNEIGNITGVVLVFRDITERKRVEKEKSRLAEQLRQSQKLEAIGQLAGGIAHDFNNILTGIFGFAELTLGSLSNDHPTVGFIKKIMKKSEQAANLVSQLLAYSKKQVLNVQQIDLNPVVMESIMFLERIINKGVEVKTKLSQNLEPVLADSNALQQIITNLCLNAQDAMPYGGKLYLKTENVIINHKDCSFNSITKPGNYIKLSVSDTGIGMEEELQKHIFEPFFTTKKIGKGTGLGLSMVFGLVEQHNGFIRCTSKVNRGSTFELFFPAVHIDNISEKISTVEQAAGRHETILTKMMY